MIDKDSSQILPNKRRPRPSYTKGKGGYINEESNEMSGSNDNIYSMEDSSANLKKGGRQHKKKIGKSAKGVRKTWLSSNTQ